MDVIFIGGVAIQHLILSDQTVAAFDKEDFMTELDRFSRFATLDQRRVRFEDRIDFFSGRNLFAIDDAAAGLIDDAITTGKLLSMMGGSDDRAK